MSGDSHILIDSSLSQRNCSKVVSLITAVNYDY